LYTTSVLLLDNTTNQDVKCPCFLLLDTNAFIIPFHQVKALNYIISKKDGEIPVSGISAILITIHYFA